MLMPLCFLHKRPCIILYYMIISRNIKLLMAQIEDYTESSTLL